jgi:hypothetical protein
MQQEYNPGYDGKARVREKPEGEPVQYNRVQQVQRKVKGMVPCSSPKTDQLNA